MRIAALIVISVLTAAVAAAEDVRFVAPLDGSQPLGITAIEIATGLAAVDRVEFHVDGVLAGVVRTPPFRIAYDFGMTLDSRTISATVWTGGYASRQTVSVRTAAMSSNESITVDLVEIPLRVQSRRMLRPGDITVRENGRVQNVREVLRERPPAHFAFVVDRSLSMGDGRLQAALEAVQSGLSQLREGDTASLVVFNHHVARSRPITAGMNLVAELADLTPSGGTSLRDAIASVASEQRTYAIAITDGGDRNSALGEEAALRKISGTRAIVSAIVLGTSAPFLDRAASNTGGTVLRANGGSIGTSLSSLLSDINSRYLVVYQSSAASRGWRSVDVRARSGVQIVSARKGYFAEP